MKTAISIPDPVFRAGERFAKKSGVTRSALYAKALREFLERQRDDEVTARLDDVYASEDSSLDPFFRTAQKRAVGRAPSKK